MSAVSLLARALARPAVVDWLIRRATRTPYYHIRGPEGTVYMERYWLFNPLGYGSDGGRTRWPWLPSVRLHLIRREDTDRHKHDHPWNARSFILRGWYHEVRNGEHYVEGWGPVPAETYHIRKAGDTMTLEFGEFHRIAAVAAEGVWTLFVTGRKRGTWGFLVDGHKVPWREYLGVAK